MADLLATASGDQVTVRTTAVGEAVAALKRAGADGRDRRYRRLDGVRADGREDRGGAPAETVLFSEVSAHRASLEEAYLELTRDVVDYRAEPVRGAAR